MAWALLELLGRPVYRPGVAWRIEFFSFAGRATPRLTGPVTSESVGPGATLNSASVRLVLGQGFQVGITVTGLLSFQSLASELEFPGPDPGPMSAA